MEKENRDEQIKQIISQSLMALDESLISGNNQDTLSFEGFLEKLLENPSRVVRNVFQIFHDMIKSYVGDGYDEYPEDPESIHFVDYDCSRLLVEKADHPFFADRLFANRLINHVEAMRHGAQQNKIYIFEGPHGSGKSTFLNNLLKKFEEYANTDDGFRYEALWRIERDIIAGSAGKGSMNAIEKLARLIETPSELHPGMFESRNGEVKGKEVIEIPCPSHDHPLLILPKATRRRFLDEMFRNDEFKWKLFTDKEYEWVFRESSCTICSSIYNALLDRLKSPKRVFDMLCARKYRFNRRLGEGISVFNPGDKPSKNFVLVNDALQKRIDDMLEDSNMVKYLHSRYAKSNNGIYALMDIKGHNTERLSELHNIISEGVHKVEEIEENVNSLFFALMNPEDKDNIKKIPSFTDRIENIKILYIMDIKTEVEIYRNIFGKHIDSRFLPRVLHNFARVIISSRLNTKSEALLKWIEDPRKYRNYCDENLLLLKMEIFTGFIPPWLTEEDRKKFTAKIRNKIIAESETEGQKGFSGRDSIKIFNEFFSMYSKDGNLINMSNLRSFFTKIHKEYNKFIPENFLESLLHLYNYTTLQEVKECLYYYNEAQIDRDIKNYIFAVNFEDGNVETCNYTGDKLEVGEEFFKGIEVHLLPTEEDRKNRMKYRREIQQEYTSRTLTQEIMVEGKDLENTELYAFMHERYVHNLKEKVLEPFLENENFRNAVKDFGKEEFKTYDQRIRDDVSFLINNLCEKFKYTLKGATEICIYVIDNELAKKPW